MTEDTPSVSWDELDHFARNIDHLFTHPSQNRAFHQYLDGLLGPSTVRKNLTGLAEITGTTVDTLQHFLVNVPWSAAEMNDIRLRLLMAQPDLQSSDAGTLVILMQGERKQGHHTAFVVKQYFACRHVYNLPTSQESHIKGVRRCVAHCTARDPSITSDRGQFISLFLSLGAFQSHETSALMGLSRPGDIRQLVQGPNQRSNSLAY